MSNDDCFPARQAQRDYPTNITLTSSKNNYNTNEKQHRRRVGTPAESLKSSFKIEQNKRH
ncbi:hypothetical protein [Prevotella aurantiaca]|uniref:hypothetical protein n=1 Tax=Prevotella aurantiaca TaxID=596085 RepID=UPI0023F08B48